MFFTYQQETHNVVIRVEPTYLPEESLPQNDQYVFSYHIEIENLNSSSIQLISRHWKILDGKGKIEEVYGTGVVGCQPIIPSKDFFSYSSFCPLPTPTGNMRGFFEFIDSNKVPFKVPVPLFFLRTDEYGVSSTQRMSKLFFSRP